MTETADPLVSIVLATYNGAAYLNTQLESLLQQTYSNIEIVAVDDGSTDVTVQILKNFASRHQNMKVFINEKNLGFARNFEKGCRLSSGQFISLCDQDDYWHVNKVKLLVESIGEQAMIYCDSKLCNKDLQPTGSNVSDRVNCQPFDSCLQLAVFCRIYGHATLFKSSLVKDAYPFLEIIPHDWWLSYVATLHGGIAYLNVPLVFYRQHSTNLFGVVGGKSKKKSFKTKRKIKRLETIISRKRMNVFYDFCPDVLVKEKKLLNDLNKSYTDFSLKKNIQRMFLFLKNKDILLTVKRQSPVRKFLFCLKMFYQVK